MFATLLYYLWLRNADISFGRKIAIGMLCLYVMYYLMYYVVFRDRIFANWFILVIAVDIFLLGVLLVKYKNMKWDSFIFSAVTKTI